ncbi:MAG: prephenate dehydrogenase/arogenate dehydrogenase family protein, partial [Deltaproteobacteria bacterium]|nr:prephenate dehydrogenase/arogenate dehydrogenase family protein [Deltaproteobacteria bacterium]
MKIAVIGAGKMGRWFIEELSKDNETAVYDIVEGKAGNIRNAKSLESFEDLREFGPDMLLNAVTLQNTVDAFESSMEFLPEGCVLVDVASIKGPLPQFYAGCGFRFVSMHPMFGPTFATMDSLR